LEDVAGYPSRKFVDWDYLGTRGSLQEKESSGVAAIVIRAARFCEDGWIRAADISDQGIHVISSSVLAEKI